MIDEPLFDAALICLSFWDSVRYHILLVGVCVGVGFFGKMALDDLRRLYLEWRR
jgi:hypothetical protein